jgi:hypothetical protein
MALGRVKLAAEALHEVLDVSSRHLAGGGAPSKEGHMMHTKGNRRD